MTEEQQQLGQKIDWKKAEEFDLLDSKFFKPETNILYRIGIGSYELIRRKEPDFNDKAKIVEKTVLVLKINKVNNAVVAQIWDVRSAKLREKFKPYCENGSLTKYQFDFKRTGVGPETDYNLTPVLEGGAQAPPIPPSFYSAKAPQTPAVDMKRVKIIEWREEGNKIVGPDMKTYTINVGEIMELPAQIAKTIITLGYAKAVD